MIGWSILRLKLVRLSFSCQIVLDDLLFRMNINILDIVLFPQHLAMSVKGFFSDNFLKVLPDRLPDGLWNEEEYKEPSQKVKDGKNDEEDPSSCFIINEV